MTLLSEYATDLTKQVRNHPGQYATIGRDKEIEQLIETLCRKGKRNPLVIAEPGIGKTNLIEGLAQRINKGQVPDKLCHRTIYVLELSSLQKQGKNFIELFTKIINELKDNQQIVFIDEIHTIVGTGSAGGSALDVGNILKPALARNEITVIGATTVKEYHKYIEKDGALARRFSVINIPEPTAEECYKILSKLLSKYELYHALKIDDKVAKTAVDYAIRYVPDHFLPDKAFDLLDDSCAFAAAHDIKTVTPITVAKVIEQRKHIPLHQIMKNRVEQLRDMQQLLTKNVKGQPEAIKGIAIKGIVDALTLYFAGFNDAKKPISSFLFLGMPGTGKTETAKQLATALFGSPDAMVRLDMSEYNDEDSVHKLLGTANAGGTLTEAVKRAPFSIILLDEIEKGSPKVQDLFLQILQDGILHDSDNQPVSFKNTIIIMTTNLASKVVNDQEQFNHQNKISPQREQQYKNVVDKALKNEFRPEFINRIEHVEIFNMLDDAIVLSIAQKMLDDFSYKLAQRNVSVRFSADVAKYLATVGFDIKNGARTIGYMLNEKVATPLAKVILQQKPKVLLQRKFVVQIDGRWPGVYQGHKDRFGDLRVIIEVQMLSNRSNRTG